MADILNIGLSALLAQQRALTTTANNIANASTPGYSRQRVELTSRATEQMGQSFVGTGVDIALTRRFSDDILAGQMRTAAGGFHRADAMLSLASSLDDLLAGTETGLTATMEGFANALQAVANDPSATSSREALLSEARNLVGRLDALDQRLTTLADEVRTRMTSAADRVSALGAELAEINRQLIAAGTATGRRVGPAPGGLACQPGARRLTVDGSRRKPLQRARLAAQRPLRIRRPRRYVSGHAGNRIGRARPGVPRRHGGRVPADRRVGHQRPPDGARRTQHRLRPADHPAVLLVTPGRRSRGR